MLSFYFVIGKYIVILWVENQPYYFMKYHKHFFLGIIIFLTYACKNDPPKTQPKTENLLSYVDPFIGTGGHGHTYPGATTPFGMVQVSPINGINGWDWCSGYHYSDSVIVGFGNLHLSGTGIGDLADLLLMPTHKTLDLSTLPQGEKEQYPKNASELRDILPYKSKFSHANEKASPGYYQVYLEDPKINVELTASKRTGIHKYTFEKDSQQSVVLDLGFAINWDKATATQINQTDSLTITGFRHSTGWAKNQKLFYVIKFSKPITSIDLYADGKQISGTHNVTAEKTAAQIYFDTQNNQELIAHVSISSVSIENAIVNLTSEKLDAVFDFEQNKKNAEKLWEDTLSKIRIETPTDSLKTIFYTALYHTQIAPVTFSDVNGEFRLENDSIAKAVGYTAYSTLSLWDTFRAEHPLLTILAEKETSDIINSMLAYYQVNQTLPVWTLYGNETNTMTGYHSVAVIAEAYLKGIRGFDAEKTYEAMKTTMMKDDRGLEFYKKYGYIPYDTLDESVTITLEYAYDDWCLAQMALALGKNDDYTYFMKRSEAYKQLFDPKTGFMRGKSADGKSWREPFDPKHSNHREHTDYTEGNAWQHSWFVPHDVDGLIALHGGNEKFSNMLEQLFTESSEITGDFISADITGLIGQYAHGNEPSHHIAYMFNHAQQPWRTQYWVNEILKTQYSTQPDGLSGNEDCGQMSAWYVFSAMGFYPMNPASTEYEITSPLFEKSTIQLNNKKTFTIIAKDVTAENMYIQSATLNGKPFHKTTLSHSTILSGGTLEFQMGNKPNTQWGIN